MAIDYSQMAYPKSRNKALDKQDQAKALAAKDKAENAKAKKRAKGRCEVFEEILYQFGVERSERFYARCQNKDCETHHLIGGIGRRNRGELSILSQYKLRVCASHHREITANILKPTTAVHDALTVRFWRSR